jgi:hypothetical protein
MRTAPRVFAGIAGERSPQPAAASFVATAAISGEWLI